jgi:hypothetical protein
LLNAEIQKCFRWNIELEIKGIRSVGWIGKFVISRNEISTNSSWCDIATGEQVFKIISFQSEASVNTELLSMLIIDSFLIFDLRGETMLGKN